MHDHPQDLRWMREAIALSRKCPPSDTAFSVGAIIVDANGEEISRGYSRETDAHVHAEEAAIAKAAGDSRLADATLYSTLEPCSERRSRPRTCTQLILAAGIPRVAIAWREPSHFVAEAQGFELLTAAGVSVVELEELAAEARLVNQYVRQAEKRDR